MFFYHRQCGSLIIFALICLLLILGCGGNDNPTPTAASPTPTSSQPTPTPAPAQPVQVVPEMFVANANAPVKMAFAPDGRLFYNELKTGNVRIVKDAVLQPQPFASVQVDTSGETGLLGIAVDPNFATNHFVWVLSSAPTGRNVIAHFTD